MRKSKKKPRSIWDKLIPLAIVAAIVIVALVFPNLIPSEPGILGILIMIAIFVVVIGIVIFLIIMKELSR